MPLKPFQQNYWMHSDTSVAPVRVAMGGYPPWQASIVASLFGAVWDYLLTALEKISWSWRLVRRVRRLSKDQQTVLFTALAALEHPKYPLALDAVKRTARTLGFNNPEAWKPLSHGLKADAGSAENTFRHLNACTLFKTAAWAGEASANKLGNPDVNLFVELAYRQYAARGRQRGDD